MHALNAASAHSKKFRQLNACEMDNQNFLGSTGNNRQAENFWEILATKRPLTQTTAWSRLPNSVNYRAAWFSAYICFHGSLPSYRWERTYEQCLSRGSKRHQTSHWRSDADPRIRFQLVRCVLYFTLVVVWATGPKPNQTTLKIYILNSKPPRPPTSITNLNWIATSFQPTHHSNHGFSPRNSFRRENFN